MSEEPLPFSDFRKEDLPSENHSGQAPEEACICLNKNKCLFPENKCQWLSQKAEGGREADQTARGQTGSLLTSQLHSKSGVKKLMHLIINGLLQSLSK